MDRKFRPQLISSERRVSELLHVRQTASMCAWNKKKMDTEGRIVAFTKREPRMGIRTAPQLEIMLQPVKTLCFNDQVDVSNFKLFLSLFSIQVY